MGPLHELDPALVAAFALAAFVVTAGAVLVSGFLPRRSGPAGATGVVGAVLVYGAAAMLALLLLATFSTAVMLPWAVALLVAGLAFLAAPFAVQPLPAGLRESRAGLVAVVALSAATLLLLPSPGFL